MFLNLFFLTAPVADTAAKAAANTAEAAKQYDTLSLWDLTLKGGPVMIPIALLLVIAVYIFIERYMTTSKAAKEDTGFMNNIKLYITEGKIDQALTLCRSNQTPMARLIEKGISRIGRPLNDISTAIENEGKLQVGKLEKSVTFLSVIAGVGPMLGFLGTVTGMINAFYELSKSGDNLDIGILSGGIYEAMVTTVAGLIVGILAFLAYNIIVARVEKIVYILEARSTEFMDILNEPA
jgi:biopolymer transport protein ExbB